MKFKKKDISLEALNEIFEFISKKEARQMRWDAENVYSGDDPRLKVTREPRHKRRAGSEKVYMTASDRRKYHRDLTLKERRAMIRKHGALGGLTGGLAGLGLVLGAHQINKAIEKRNA